MASLQSRSPGVRSLVAAFFASGFLLALGGLHGCTGHVVPKGHGSAGVGAACTPDLGSIQSTVFGSCVGAGCHNANDKAAALNLETSEGGSQLVGVGAGTCEGWTRVVPGNPEQSLLYAKLAGAPPCGAPMPLGAHLADADVECIRGWIASLSNTGGDGGCSTCGGATCIDLAADPMNCGACGQACPAGTACVNGTCACGGGLTACGATCVDTQTNISHCGDCATACDSAASCTGGQCMCSGGLASCGGSCVDVETDAKDCGQCGHACPTGASCAAGMCVCPSGTSECNGACVETSSDAMNCGTCGRVCGIGEVCNAGNCATGCGTLTQCGTSCVDTTKSSLNCGACGKTCPSGASCVVGACACPAGTSDCGGTCVSTSTNLNCGKCGNVCSGGSSCTSGSCQCGAGQTLCNGSCVNAQTDSSNCGTCGHLCASAQTCQAGSCICANGGTVCGTACVLTASDTSNCGTCGNVCAPGQTCSAGTCTCGSASASFSGAVQPILTSNCTTTGCHIGTMPKEGLNLGAGKSYAGLVNVTTTECKDGRKRVQPGSPSTSYLIQKLTNVNLCFGSQMPKAGQGLSGPDTQTIVNWICSGAPNN